LKKTFKEGAASADMDAEAAFFLPVAPWERRTVQAASNEFRIWHANAGIPTRQG
jgi:hypothetical protein